MINKKYNILPYECKVKKYISNLQQENKVNKINDMPNLWI